MSNKQKTPLQRLIAEYERLQNDAKTFQEKIFFNGVIAVAKTKLPYEREVIENFHIETMKKGLKAENEIIWTDAYYPKIKQNTQESFNQTFQTNE
jgi:hypothetical protein